VLNNDGVDIGWEKVVSYVDVLMYLGRSPVINPPIPHVVKVLYKSEGYYFKDYTVEIWWGKGYDIWI
jgi:hypothetical protein